MYPTTPLTSTQRVALEALLTEAQQAYHNLMVGGSARVVVDQNGQRVEFTAINASKLASYILSLQSQLGVCNGSPMLIPGGPAKFIF